ncbi:MAG: hypothetical protein B6V02_03345 [Thermoprotei archaeon ex4572_64]|nr:MAG: hypothetical protein B6V02_03345 [Thermoprotei archaeon ex4572_64]
MGRLVTVSTKVPEELKREAEELGINIFEFLRKALEEEVKRRRLEKLKKDVKMLSQVLDKLSIEEIVHKVRKDREEVIKL